MAAVAAVALAAAIVLGATTGQLSKKQPTPPSEAPRSVQLLGPGRLETGHYDDPLLNPRVSFSIPDDTVWRATLVKGSSLVLTSDDSPPTASIALVHWSSVHDPATGEVSRTSTAAGPGSLIPWLSTHPSLHVVAGPTSTSLAGGPAQMLTFALAQNPRLPAGRSPDCPDRAACLALFETLDNPVVVGSRDKTTVITRDDAPAGLVLVMTFHGASDSVDEWHFMNEIVDSLRTGE